MNRLWPAVVAVALVSAGCGGNKPVPAQQTGPKVTTTAPPPATTEAALKPQVAPPPPPLPPKATKVSPPSVKPPEPVATVRGVSITREQFLAPLVEAHGLNVLMQLVQLELAKQEASKLGVTVTPQDIQAEQDITLRLMFKDVNPKLSGELRDAEATHQEELASRLREQLAKDTQTMLEQLLQQQKSSKAEFLLLMQTNAYLRKGIEKQLQGKISDDNVRTAFNLTYGETVRVKHIQCSNLQEIAEVQRRLEAGESFEKVAQEVSRNALTRPQGGALPPFSRETPGLPAAFKDVAFALKEPGEVSEPILADEAYHILKLVEKIPPKAVKFEDVKGSVRQHLFTVMVQEQMKTARADLARQALETLEIKDPVLARQYQSRLTQRDAEMRDREQISRELERQRQGNRPLPTTAPNRMPSDAAAVDKLLPTTVPAAADKSTLTGSATSAGAGVARPPATQSGSDTPDVK